MASKNGNDCASSSQTPDTVVCDSLTAIKKEQKTALSDKMADETTRLSKEAAKGYKICCLDRAEETHSVYQDLMTCIALGQYKKTEIIQKNLDDYIKKDDAIEKLITESSALLKDLCTKLVEANDELCTMSNCVKNKVLSKSSKVSAKDKEKVEECLEEITTKTKKLVDKGKNAVESIVTIAGIQTFTNTESLKEFVEALMEKMTAFKDCTEVNINSTSEEVKVSREELNVIVQELAQIECDFAAECTTIEGLKLVVDFICGCDCDGECLDLCKEFEKCCEKTDKEPTGKSKPKQRADQN
jgi:Zn-dependent M16 (insulinase) family peptidase